VGLEVGGEVIPAEAGIWIPRRRRAGGGFRNDESRLESRSHSIGEESVASRKRA
jgi:hypothetical protein